MKAADLPTPCALVDLDVVERNTARMAERAAALGVRLRPHVKTHKCLEAARLQVRGMRGPITVSTLAEARFFADEGFDDITYAVAVAPSRLPDIRDLVKRVDRLNLLVDHPGTIDRLEDDARHHGVLYRVFLEVDCGYHRAGVDPMSSDALELANRLASSKRLELQGILTHAGHAYASRNADEIRRVAAQERDVTIGFAQRLRDAGISVSEVSVGSTPTMCLAEDLTGVTEMRPGNYVFFDAFQAAIGSCAVDDVAFSIAAEVIGQYPAQNRLLVNAGALAFSKDPGACHLDASCGYGIVQSLDGRASYPDLRLFSLSQEHGQITSDRPIAWSELPIGTKLRILPNHSCLAAACFDCYEVLRGDQVVDRWHPVRGW